MVDRRRMECLLHCYITSNLHKFNAPAESVAAFYGYFKMKNFVSKDGPKMWSRLCRNMKGMVGLNIGTYWCQYTEQSEISVLNTNISLLMTSMMAWSGTNCAQPITSNVLPRNEAPSSRPHTLTHINRTQWSSGWQPPPFFLQHLNFI